MGINYTKAARTALRLLQANGRAVQLVKLNTSPLDDNKPWRGSQENLDTKITVTAVFIDPVSEKDLGSSEMLTNVGNETSVKHGFQIAFIAATENLDVDGNPEDLSQYHRMIDGGLVYRMTEIHTLSPGGSALMYEVKLER
ncbi:MAG: hypothetical protein ACTSYX_04565 [Candidatus Thorarchaeota archaeon]